MLINQNITFGKYIGFTVKEVYQGSNNINKDLLKSYLKARLENTSSNYNECAVLLDFMTFEISDTIIRVTTSTDNLNKDWSKSIEGIFKDVKNSLTNPFLEILTLDYFNTNFFSLAHVKTRISPNGNPSYIEWCINNVEHFILNPNVIKELNELDIYTYAGIDVTHKIDDIYLYKERFKIRKFTFSDDTIKLNQEKYYAFLRLNDSNHSDEDAYGYFDSDNCEDDYCGGCESSPCRCSDPDPG